MSKFLQLRNVSVHYSTPDNTIVRALNDINLTIEKGEIVFVTGASGAGKSTLFRLISLLEKPTLGEILVADKNLSTLPKITIASYRQQIALVPQDPMLLNDRTVSENILFALKINGLKPDECAQRIQANLSTVEMEKFKNSSPLSLSAGEKQRISLARALAKRPKILLADEPTGNLDPELSRSIMKTLISTTEQSQTTLLISTHELALVEAFRKYKTFRHIKLNQGSLE